MNKKCLKYIISIFFGIVLSSCIRSSNKKDISEDDNNVFSVNLDMSRLSIENHLVTTIGFDSIELFDTLETDQNTLLYFFDPSKSCMSCVKEILQFIDTIYDHQKELNLDDIILVSKYDNPKYLTVLRNRYNIKYTCLNSEADPIDKGNTQVYSDLYDNYFLFIKNYKDFKFYSRSSFEPLVPDVFLSDLKEYFN